MAISKNLVPPYSGDKPYIFISYAHKDREEQPYVDSIILFLQSQGFRVWYDEGIDPGTEWAENIADHVDGCSYFIALISKKYLASTNCKDELEFARDGDKKRLMIYLEECKLPRGIAMRINRLQSIFMYKYDNFDDFTKKLMTADGIDVCLSDTDEPDVADEEMRQFWERIDARYKAEFGEDADQPEQEALEDAIEEYEIPKVGDYKENSTSILSRLWKLFRLAYFPFLIAFSFLGHRTALWEYVIGYEALGYKSYLLVEKFIATYIFIFIFLALIGVGMFIWYLRKNTMMAVVTLVFLLIWGFLNTSVFDNDINRAKCSPTLEVYYCTMEEHNAILTNSKSLAELTPVEVKRSDVPDQLYGEFFYGDEEYAVVTRNSQSKWDEGTKKLDLSEDVYAVYFPADYVRYLFISGQYGE